MFDPRDGVAVSVVLLALIIEGAAAVRVWNWWRGRRDTRAYRLSVLVVLTSSAFVCCF